MDKYEMLMKCFYALNSDGKVKFDEYVENAIMYPEGMLSLLFSMYVKKIDFTTLDNYFKTGKIYYAIKQAIIDNHQMSINNNSFYLKLKQEFEDIINNSYYGKYIKEK